jgi:hypothetical protein
VEVVSIRIVRVRGTRAQPIDDVRSETIADLSAVESLQERLAVAQRTLDGISQCFGIAECTQLRGDGSVVAAEWSMSVYARGRDWARREGVEVRLLPGDER